LRRIVTGIEGWSTWREQPEVWAWVSELATREPVEGADADVLRMGALAAWRLGRLNLMRRYTARCVAADPADASGAAAASALMLLAFAERRWAAVVELAGRVRAARPVDGGVAMALSATALARMGRPEEALAAARGARRDAEPYGPSVRAMALLAEARAWAAADPMSTDGRADALLITARLLAHSVGSAELVASIDKERGLQALNRGLPERAIEPLRSACLHWLGTGNADPLVETVEGLAISLAGTGHAEVAQRILNANQAGKLTGRILASTLPPDPPLGPMRPRTP
jgi:hypothetical protein